MGTSVASTKKKRNKKVIRGDTTEKMLMNLQKNVLDIT